MKWLKKWIRVDAIQTKKQKFIERINNILTNIFNERSTEESIELFLETKLKFEEELNRRSILAEKEQQDIKNYFTK